MLDKIDQESEAVRVGFRITLADLKARVARIPPALTCTYTIGA